MARNPHRSDRRLETVLEEIGPLNLEGARRRWQELYGSPAPPTLRKPLLQAALAYRLQERALGGLKPATKRLLRRVAEQADHRELAVTEGARVDKQQGTEDKAGNKDIRRGTGVSPARIKPGTRLLRTWRGMMHEILVLETGVTYRGQPYRSLSEVARLITGQRWSGPRFFGLQDRPAHAET